MFRRKPPPQPEWLIVGLGNPGGEHEDTRHNVGFDVVRELGRRHRIPLKHRRLQANFGMGRLSADGPAVALVRPMTFMNRSGRAVRALSSHFGVEPARIVVVYDDMDLEVGRVRIKPKGGPGAHNGMESVIASLRTTEFPRVRIGIGGPDASGTDHVLSRFHRDEIEPIREAIQRAADGCELIAGSGVDFAMNRINLPKEQP
ncbi:MAG: aminoacyl-tRNA hydrolase [Armatimonadetes bacterium]|nr:aminoacyl-tRNA hydrolase [Armatimonadota bacterium]